MNDVRGVHLFAFTFKDFSEHFVIQILQVSAHRLNLCRYYTSEKDGVLRVARRH